MALYADHDGDNISWTDDLPGFEPWEPDEPEDDGHDVGPCHYCADPAPQMRENPEPFGGRECCESCFNILIGGEPDDPPWRCGNAS